MENLQNLIKNWDQLKEKIKESNVNITDSDLVLVNGKEDELFESLGKKLNKSKQEIKDWIQSISSTQSIAG
jgi:uncharacterized protein YjbJ (UPF0337 family)